MAKPDPTKPTPPTTSSRAPKAGDKVLAHFMVTPGPQKRTAEGVIAGVDPDGLVSISYTPRGRTAVALLERVPYGTTGPVGYVFDG